ncbi:ATP-binding protein [Pseudomonas sp. GZD-222]|uniref:hybrid sensor histidine kinase/response regulator n=1 Tax=Pseudomonas sp. GZD-222 TaxID=3404805 RepID=UPI003BB66289
MKADTLFGLLVKSSMRLSTGLFLTLGLVFLLAITNVWAIFLLLGSEEEKAASHFARVMENVKEQEVFLQAISAKLVEHTDELVTAPENLKPTFQFVDTITNIYEVSESSFSLPFTVAVALDQKDKGLSALSSIGWHLANYYSRFWAQSHFLSPQVFVFSPENVSSIAVPAIGKFRDENLLTSKNYSAISRALSEQTTRAAARLSDHKIHWTRPESGAQPPGNSMQMLAYVHGRLPNDDLRLHSGMEHVVVATLFDVLHLSEGAPNSDLPFHGRFTLIDPEGNILIGHREASEGSSGLSFTGNGLLISVLDTAIKNEKWLAQYFIDYRGLARWAALPILRIFIVSILLFVLFRVLYHYYKKRVVIPAKKAQAELVESHAFNHAIVEGAPAGLVVIRLSDGQVVLENKRAQAGSAVSQSIVNMLRKPGVILSGDACMTLQGCYYLVSYSFARYQEQDVLLCAFSDVTEHQQRSVALHKAKLGAERANNAKTIFLATMSHEIRTPLYGVLGTLELLSLTRLDQRQQDYLRTMHASSSTVLQIISDVLDVSKIESGQLELDVSSFPTLDFVEGVMSTHVAAARAKGLQIYACIDPDIPALLFGDQVKIRQILNNLLSNAIKFTGIGRVVLRCRVKKEGGRNPVMEYQVADSGIGITPEQQLHIFEPFYQASTSNVVSGTGLGLSICSRFVELMDGELTVTSEQGLGSSFTVRLPFIQSEPGPVKDTALDLGGRQVYVHAPAPELAENICAWMTRYGASATVVSARSHKMLSDALLVDVLGGGELRFTWNGKRLSCDHEGPQVPELTATGFRVSAHHIRAIAQGVLIACEENYHPAPAADGATLPALKLHVLVAEDNLINQAILKEQLETLGCSVIVASNGDQALELWEQGDFDVVLSDVNMPVLNGYELAKKIRRQDRDVPIIGITANAMRDEGERCCASGMSAWMVKPLKLTTLHDMLVSVERVERVEHSNTAVSRLSCPAEPDNDAATVVLSDAMRGLFQRTMQQDLDAIRSAMARGAQTDAVEILHSVSGALSVVRAEKLSLVFGQLEHQLREQTIDSALVTEIDRALDRLSALLASV